MTQIAQMHELLFWGAEENNEKYIGFELFVKKVVLLLLIVKTSSFKNMMFTEQIKH